MPEPGRKITIQLDPDDEELSVELSLVDELITKEGRGQYFQRRITKFNNGEDTSRVYAVREITHKKRLPGMVWKGPDRPPEFSDEEDDEDDEDQIIKVEVIFEMTTQEGSGQSYRKRIYTLNWDDEQSANGRRANFRNSHIKRIKNKDDEDIWIDVRRKDQFITFEGSGLSFRRRLTSVAWNDGEDANPFDTNDLPAEPVPADPEAPYRLDFLQDIVNVNVGIPDILVLIISRSYNTQDELGLDGNVKLSVTTTKHKPPPDQAQLLYPPITDANVDVAYQKRIPDPPPPLPPLTPVPIVDPMSTAMNGKLLAWTRGLAVGDGQIYSEPEDAEFLGSNVFGDKRIALFINIKKLFPTKSEELNAHGDVTIKIPGFNEPAFLYLIEWHVPITAHASLRAVNPPDDYFQYVNGTDADIQFRLDQLNAFGATDIKILDAINVTQDDYPVTVAARHHLPGGTILPNSELSQDEYFVPASWSIAAYTFRKNKDFPLETNNQLNLTELAAKDPPVTPEHLGSISGSAVFMNPLEDATVRVRVKFPDLELELQTV